MAFSPEISGRRQLRKKHDKVKQDCRENGKRRLPNRDPARATEHYRPHGQTSARQSQEDIPSPLPKGGEAI